MTRQHKGAATDRFSVPEMDCPNEERLIRDRFKTLPEINSVEFDLMARRLTVAHRLGSVEPLIQALQSLGMNPVLLTSQSAIGANAATDAEDHDFPRGPSRRTLVLMAISGAAAITSEVVAWSSGTERSWPVIALAVVAILTGRLETLRKGFLALRNLSLNMNFLMSIAVVGAAAIGQWPEAAVVIFLFAVAEMIEGISMDRARNAVRSLMAMTPELATVRQPDGAWHELPAREVAVDATVRVRPGERIALDGTVVEGRSTVNQAPITGESIPVPKEPGDPVFAGTINERGAFDYRVTAVQSKSTLARIMTAVQEAQGQRAPTQRFVDRFARYYVPAVVVVAVLVAIVPPLLLGAPFTPWFYKALVLLVIACPCALIISTPVTVVSGLAAAARHGILIKGGVYLEESRTLKTIALDKTGTITFGRPVVTATRLAGEGSETKLLGLAASLASRSDHPVSGAVLAHWKTREPKSSLQEVEGFEALTGRGVKGRIAGEILYLGNHRLAEELGICGPKLETELEAFEREGNTTVVLCSPAAPLLILAAADTVRETSADAVSSLRELGVKVVMLTGDNPHTATAIGAKVGITDARGNLLPEDKLAAIQELIERYGHVGMVGDGINDAPALAKASIGFAMGAAGSDTALETADVALMDDDLRKIPDFIRLGRKTYAVLWQNITVALVTKLVVFVLALTGQATLWMAVFADLGASLLVIGNGLRLLRGVGPGQRARAPE